jgi:hypothetical protein
MVDFNLSTDSVCCERVNKCNFWIYEKAAKHLVLVEEKK